MAGIGRARQNAMEEGCPQKNPQGGRWERRSRIEPVGVVMCTSVVDITLAFTNQKWLKTDCPLSN